MNLPSLSIPKLVSAGIALALTGCGTPKPPSKSTESLPPVTGSAPSGSSSARPVNHLSKSEFPFDASGNYVTSWVTGASASPPSYSKKKTTPSSSSKPRAKKSTARYHVVKRGDTLYGLSRRYGTSVSAIQRANGLRGSTIQSGQRLRVQ